jgi:hypothetical protein
MKNQTSAIIASAASLAVLVPPILAECDSDVEQYSDVESPEVSSSCPGVGACSYTVTEGAYYCDSNWFFDQGCILDSNSELFQDTYVGDCDLQEISVGFFTKTIATCGNYTMSDSRTVPGAFAMPDARCYC